MRRGDLAAAQADAQAAIELAPDLLGARFLVLAVSAAVLAGLERDETPDSLAPAHRPHRRPLRHRVHVELPAALRLRRASRRGRQPRSRGRGAAGLRARPPGVRRREPGPARRGARRRRSRWPSSAATTRLAAWPPTRCAARSRSARRARSASRCAPRRSSARPPSGRSGSRTALAVLAPSPARLEHARVLVDLGATLRAAGQRTAAREPLLDGLALAARCGAPNPGAPGAGRARGDRRPAPDAPTAPAPTR